MNQDRQVCKMGNLYKVNKYNLHSLDGYYGM